MQRDFVSSAEKEFKKYENMRMQMYDYFDRLIPKTEDGVYDFSQAKKANSQELFDMFFKLDYQARKIRGIAIQCLGLEAK